MRSDSESSRPQEDQRPPRRRSFVALSSVVIGALAGGAVLAATGAMSVERKDPAGGSTSGDRTADPTPAPTSTGAAPTAGTQTPVDAAAIPDVAKAPSPSQAKRSAARLFAPDSPWNTPIPADPAIDPRSAAVEREVLRNRSLVVNTAVYAYGIPFYTATASTPRVRLSGRGDIGATIPIDPSWKPNEGGDRKMNVIDPARGLIYELQGYDPRKKTVFWIVVRDIVAGKADGASSGGRRGPTGSGLTQAGGVIRVDEIRNGRIDHALSFITSRPAAKRFRYPATHTDGENSSAGAMEEGMRVQLDPSLDLKSLGLSRAEYAIARAMQVYGAYCTDNGQGNNMAMGFYMEKPTAATGDPYGAAGIPGDWTQLKKIPRSAYRVLDASVTRP